MKRIEKNEKNEKKSRANQLLQHKKGALWEHEPDSVNYVYFWYMVLF